MKENVLFKSDYLMFALYIQLRAKMLKICFSPKQLSEIIKKRVHMPITNSFFLCGVYM